MRGVSRFKSDVSSKPEIQQKNKVQLLHLYYIHHEPKITLVATSKQHTERQLDQTTCKNYTWGKLFTI